MVREPRACTARRRQLYRRRRLTEERLAALPRKGLKRLHPGQHVGRRVHDFEQATGGVAEPVPPREQDQGGLRDGQASPPEDHDRVRKVVNEFADVLRVREGGLDLENMPCAVQTCQDVRSRDEGLCEDGGFEERGPGLVRESPPRQFRVILASGSRDEGAAGIQCVGECANFLALPHPKSLRFAAGCRREGERVPGHSDALLRYEPAGLCDGVLLPAQVRVRRHTEPSLVGLRGRFCVCRDGVSIDGWEH